MYSVDDNAEWLEKTKTFLAAHGLSTAHLYHWDIFLQTKQSGFDLIFHDIGNTDTRGKLLPGVLSLSASEGIVVLDDMHYHAYRPIAIEAVKKARFLLASAYSFTCDSSKRFAEVAFHV